MSLQKCIAKVLVTLYTPGCQPTTESIEGFNALKISPFAQVPPQASTLLGCSPSLVDVLAMGPNYVVYTIFDSEDNVNPIATQTVAELTGTDFDITNEDELLRGKILIVKL